MELAVKDVANGRDTMSHILVLYIPCPITFAWTLVPLDHASHINYHANGSYDPRCPLIRHNTYRAFTCTT